MGTILIALSLTLLKRIVRNASEKLKLDKFKPELTHGFLEQR